jgi:hypothetical protein
MNSPYFCGHGTRGQGKADGSKEEWEDAEFGSGA